MNSTDEDFNVVMSATATARPMASKQFSYGATQAGDCRIEPDGTFTLFADGSTAMDCIVSSGDTGDTMKVKFRCEDEHGTPLFHTNIWQHDIGAKDQKQHWLDSNGPNGEYAGFYSRVSTATRLTDC